LQLTVEKHTSLLSRNDEAKKFYDFRHRWQRGPDNVDPKDGSHITMVTADHMNQLLKLVLKLIMKHIGDDSAEWMTKIAVYAQQVTIIS
jgi:hypothetical protein